MLAAGIGPIGPIELIVILAIVIIIFGAGKITGLGSALGQSIREFRSAAREFNEVDSPPPPTAQISSGTTSEPLTCPNCSAQLETAKKFCSECGAAVATPAK